MTKTLTPLAAVIAALSIAAPAFAEVDSQPSTILEAFSSGIPAYEGPDERFAISPSVGTLGAGLEASYKVTNKISVRGGFHQFDYETDVEIEGEDFDVDLGLESFALMVDYHPFESAFRVSGGLMKNNSSASISGSYNGSFTFNGTTYTDPNPTSLTGEVEFASVSPVVSLGWNKRVSDRFTLNAELGAVLTGGADLSLSSSGGVSSDPTFQAALNDERAEMQDDLDKIKIYPVIQIGASFRF